MLPNEDSHLVCDACGMRKDPDYINSDYRIGKKRLDISHTYDGYIIVSARFRTFTEECGFSGVTFTDLPNQADIYVVNFENLLQITKPQGFKLEEYCIKCRRYRSVWGLPYVSVVIPKTGLDDGFYRSDIMMGYGLMMFPLLICTGAVKTRIKAAKLAGFSFEVAKTEIQF